MMNLSDWRFTSNTTLSELLGNLSVITRSFLLTGACTFSSWRTSIHIRFVKEAHQRVKPYHLLKTLSAENTLYVLNITMSLDVR